MKKYSFHLAMFLCEVCDARYRREEWPATRYVYVQEMYVNGETRLVYRLSDNGHICNYEPLEEDIYTADWIEYKEAM